MRSATALAVVAALLVGACGDDPSPGDRRAEQARAAALQAGLSGEVADFLALAARGATATYQATYPGAGDGATLVVANRPPERRVDVLGDDGAVVEIRLVVDGQAFECRPDERSGRVEACTRTDALVEPPGVFRDDALDRLAESLAVGRDDFDFRISDERVAGVDARCLVTERKEGRSSSDLGARGEICVSLEGALLRVEQGGEVLEATDYTTAIPAGTFVRPDTEGGAPG